MPSDGKKKEDKNVLVSSDESEGEETEVHSEEEEEEDQETEDETTGKVNSKTRAGSSTARTAANKNKKAAVVLNVKKAFKRKVDDEDEEDQDEIEMSPKKKKRVRVVAESDDEIDGEKSFQKKKKETPATKKKQPAVYDDSDVNKTFKIGCPQSVKPLKVALNNNYMLSCKMIQANENTKGGLAYDYAGLILHRRTKEDKAYEFNMPLSLGPIMMQSLEYIMTENKHFFSQKITPD